MIASLSGILEARMAEHIVVNVAGVGFKVFAPAPTAAALGEIGSPVRLHTLLYVRQEQLALFGFLTGEELRMFELLLSVSGVGPRAAINVLSAAPLAALRRAISIGDVEPLTRIAGIGQKTAGRIVLELKGKIVLDIAESSEAEQDDSEVVSALTSLGYTTGEAQAAVRSLPAETGSTTEARIMAALRYFAGR